jgi:hypothetical protein
MSGFGGASSILLLGHPLLPIPWGLYLTRALYCLAVFSVTVFSAIGLVLKPRWDRQILKIIIATICATVSFYYFSSIIIE